MFSFFLRTVGAIQMLLGLAYLFVPATLLQQLGHTAVAPDLYYPLGMLAARFLAYGSGFWLISRQPKQHTLWIMLMAQIQIIDLAVGLYYTASGVISLQLSAFPMFNAIWIGLICAIWVLRQRHLPQATA